MTFCVPEAERYDRADNAEYTQPGSNGLTVMADRYKGKRLDSANDLVYRFDGTLYFYRPPFRSPKVLR